MASFVQDLWSSIFVPGPTNSLLVATNASFAALQLVLLALLLATYSVHFVVLSFLCAGLWWSINWFAVEVRHLTAQREKEEAEQEKEGRKQKATPGVIDSTDSETETEGLVFPSKAKEAAETTASSTQDPAVLLQPSSAEAEQAVRKRRSDGDNSSSGYISTDSEWEKVDDKDK